MVVNASAPAEAVALDFSPAMLDRLRSRFSQTQGITVVAHNLDEPLPARLGTFDVVVSSFAIHHLTHERKRALYDEVYQRLRPGGVFSNLEHVARQPWRCTTSFSQGSTFDPTMRTPQTSCSTLTRRCDGSATSGSVMWTAIGSGASVHSWLGTRS